MSFLFESASAENNSDHGVYAAQFVGEQGAEIA